MSSTMTHTPRESLQLACGAFTLTLAPDVGVEVRELEAIQAGLLEGVWLGKTSALAQVEAAGREPVPGQTRYFARAALDLEWVSRDVLRVDEDGLALAWSCWEISMALVCRVRQAGFRAGVVRAFGVEGGARGEPHALVFAQSRVAGAKFLMDPYFGAGPLLLEHGVTASRTDRVSTSNVTDFDDGHRVASLTVQHIAYPGAYTYEVFLDGEVETNILASKAPAWAASRARVARASSGPLTMRVTALETATLERRGLPAGTVEVKVWHEDDGVGSRPRWTWTGIGWADVARDAHARLAGGAPLLDQMLAVPA